MKQPLLTSTNLLLRPFTVIDAPALFTYAHDQRVAALTQWKAHTSITDTQRFIQSLKGRLLWAVIEKSSNQLVGEAGFIANSKQSLEFHCAFAVAYWGKGYAHEVATTLIGFAFEQHQIEQVHAVILGDNLRARNAAVKLGMQHELTVPEQWYANGIMHDVTLYAINKFCVV